MNEPSIDSLIIEAVKATFSNIIEYRQQSKNDRFLKVIEFVSMNRGKLGRIAKEYFKARGEYALIHDDIPLLIDETVFDHCLRDINDIKLIFRNVRDEIDIPTKDLPNNNISYLQNILNLKYSGDMKLSPYEDNLCYRLKGAESPTQLYFEKCTYFDFINTCEYNLFSMSNLIINGCMESSTKKISKKIKFDPFDFTNRYMVPGINTLLIFLDKKNPIMYLHKRSKKNVAEAVNVKHVVPAGTFQPIHIDDANHEVDFSLYANLMREFGEELVGDKEIVHPRGVLENVLDRDSIKRIDHIIKRGLGKVYFGGFAIDCLNLKPEMLTIMVLHRMDYERWVGEINFKENDEGKPYAVPFTRENLEKFAFDTEMLPAGAGCLWMALMHYNKIIADFGDLKNE